MRYVALGMVLAVVAFSSGAWLLNRRVEDQRLVYEKARVLDEVISSVARLYVDSLTEADLYDLAIHGLLNSIDDPYAGFLEGDDFSRHAELTSGTYAGIGIRVESNDDWITVVTPLAGSPAADAGIQSGDRIVTVDGESARGWTPDESVDALRGADGTEVEIAVARLGVSELLPFRLERREIEINSVRHYEMVEPTVGYVWLEIVSSRSEEDLVKAIEDLRGQGAEKLVLDLRGNPGGLLTESIAITDLFTENDDAVVETRTRVAGLGKTYRAKRAERWDEMPLVVLVNQYSASAAEIIAGALQDHDRALVVGEPTFGKGLVQSVFPLGSQYALKFTTGRWYTPLGRSIQRDDRNPEDTITTVVVTEGGREIPNTGGVQPDVVQEASNAAERVALDQVLGSRSQEFRAALGAMALDAAAAAETPDRGSSLTPDFDVRSALADRQVTFSTREWNAVSPEIQREFSYLVARYGQGEAAELRLRLSNDGVLRVALDRLSGVSTVGELLGVSGN